MSSFTSIACSYEQHYACVRDDCPCGCHVEKSPSVLSTCDNFYDAFEELAFETWSSATSTGAYSGTFNPYPTVLYNIRDKFGLPNVDKEDDKLADRSIINFRNYLYNILNNPVREWDARSHKIVVDEIVEYYSNKKTDF